MITGLLWFDNSQAALTEKVRKAVAYYEKKYGRRPALCLVHPDLLAPGTEGPEPVQGVAIRPWRSIPKGHLWLGIEEQL